MQVKEERKYFKMTHQQRSKDKLHIYGERDKRQKSPHSKDYSLLQNMLILRGDHLMIK